MVRYYVIENPQGDPAKVIGGPHERHVAEHKCSVFTLQGRIMSTPMLVHAIEDNDYNVVWRDTAERPTDLHDEPGRECLRCGYVTFNDEINRDEPPGVCPECGGDLQ